MLRRPSVWAVLSVAILFMVFLAGCGGGTKSAAPPEKESASGEKSAESAQKSPLKLTLAGGAASGLWTTVGEGLGEAIKRTYPGTTFTYQPGQDGANVVTVASGKTELGIVNSPSAFWALRGEAPFQQKIPNVRAIAYLHDNIYSFTASVKSGLNSIEEVKAKKFPLVIGVNTKDGAMEITNRVVLEAYGMSYQDIEAWGGKVHFLAVTPSIDMMKDGKMHVIGSPLPLPASSIIELNVTTPLKMLPLSQQAVDLAAQKMGANPSVIPAGSYKFVDKDIPTFSIGAILITREETPQDVVYKITKAIYENMDYLHKVHPALKVMTKETIATMLGNVPLHPGAEKYYKEAGVLNLDPVSNH